MSLTQAEKRAAWSPACQRLHRDHLDEALAAEDLVMRTVGYAPRAGETWGANCRDVTGGHTPSIHSYFDNGSFTFWTGVSIQRAVAWDINSKSNPYGPTLVTDRPRAMVDAILAIRTNSGAPVLDWGGYFKGNKDGMHDEIACSPADLATGINWATVYGHPSNPSTPGEDMPLTADDKQFITDTVYNIVNAQARDPLLAELAKLEHKVDGIDAGSGASAAEVADELAQRLKA